MNLPEYTYPGDENARSDVQSGVYGTHYTFKSGDFVLDIGANVGFFSEWVFEKISPGGRLISIEPHPRNFDELKRRCGKYDGCELINAAACTTANDTAILYNNSHNSGAHSLFPAAGYPYHFSIPVPSVNVGILLSKMAVVPNFVKIDTEGSESLILESIIEKGIKPNSFAIECHSEELVKDCIEFMNGYKINRSGWMVFANI